MASSEAFDVDVQPYEVEIITAPSSDVMENEVFEVIVELQETHTGDVPTNLAEKVCSSSTFNYQYYE